ncbi:MAG: isochorismatase family cysteine hydrolase [Acetobacteraceae bacterium]
MQDAKPDPTPVADPNRTTVNDMHADLASVADPRHTAVLVVDIQNLFVGFPLHPPVEEVLPRLHRFIHAARSAGAMIVRIGIVVPEEMYSAVWQRQHGPLQHGLPGSLLAPGSEAAAFYPGFEPEPGDVVIIKPRYSAFIGTPLETVLRSKGIRTVIVGGLTTDVCVGGTARDAFQRDFTTITLSDCAAEQTLARHESGLATLASVFGMVCDSSELLDVWGAQHSRAAV